MNFISSRLCAFLTASLIAGWAPTAWTNDASNDSNAPPVLSIADAVVSESVGLVRVPITLSRAVDYPINMAMTTRRGTATNPEDFYGRGFAFSIPAGETQSTFFFRVVDDSLAEPTESLTVVILKAEDAVIGRAIATISIEDDDAGALSQFQINEEFPAREADGVAYVTVQLTPAATEETSVQIATGPGLASTALPGLDFYGFYRTLVFAPGEVEKRISITILDDDLVEEPVESFRVRLFRPSANAGLIPFRNVTSVAIFDDDAP